MLRNWGRMRSSAFATIPRGRGASRRSSATGRRWWLSRWDEVLRRQFVRIAIHFFAHREWYIMRTIGTSLLVLGLLVSSARADDKETKRKLRFTIGKETTYVTGP